MDRLNFASFETPYGPIWALRTDDGIARIILPPTTKRKVDPGPSILVDWRERHNPGFQLMESKTQFRDLYRWLRSYFGGNPPDEVLPIDFYGTPFQKAVWDIVAKIPYGHTTTYGTISKQLRQKSSSARAVGAAVGSNPVPLVVPCHRVVGVDSKLVGFGGGLKMKQDLLRREKVLLL